MPHGLGQCSELSGFGGVKSSGSLLAFVVVCMMVQLMGLVNGLIFLPAFLGLLAKMLDFCKGATGEGRIVKHWGPLLSKDFSSFGPTRGSCHGRGGKL